MLKLYTKDIIIFLLIFIILSIISIFVLQNPDWDFYNYHYYNGYALFNDRMGIDFLAANFRTYINPYVDGITYLLITKLNNHPYVFLSISSIDNTLFLFLIYKIANYIIIEQNNIKKSVILSLIVLYISFSPIMIDALNYTRNDIAIGNFILLSLYLLLKNLFIQSKHRNKLIFLSGIFLGTAVGLKLTTSVSCLTCVFCIMALYKKIPNFRKTLFLFIAGSMLSFIVLDGYFMYTLYKVYGNPLFPYYNNIFKSEYYDNINMSAFEYKGILPANFREFIFYPFYHTVKNHLWGNYLHNIDYRYAFNFIFLIILGIYIFIKRKDNSDNILNIINKNHLYFLLLFVLVSYYGNQAVTGVYRFIIATSALYGIIAFTLCVLLCKILRLNNKRFCIILFIFLTFFAYYTSKYKKYSITTPIKDAKLFYNNESYKFEDDSYVILLNMGTSFFAVGQNKKAHYYGFVLPSKIWKKHKKFIYKNLLIDMYSHVVFSKYLEKSLKDILRNPDNKVYVIYNSNDKYNSFNQEALNYYSSKTRKLENCKNIQYQGIIYHKNRKTNLCEFNIKNNLLPN